MNVIINHTNADESTANLEYHVKAGFLGNFAKFIQWPATFFPKADSPYILGIVGEDPFGTIIDQAVEGFTVGDRPMLVRRFRDAMSLKFCHILFISRSQKAHLDDILAQLRETPTLTVSDMENFCEKGGMINFILIDNNIRFAINASASKKAGLKLSSSLLSLAKAIY